MYDKVAWKLVLIVLVIAACVYFAYPPLNGMVDDVPGMDFDKFDIKVGCGPPFLIILSGERYDRQ